MSPISSVGFPGKTCWSMGAEASTVAMIRITASPVPNIAARMKTGRPPSPRTRRAAIALPVSCSRGRKKPGPHTKSKAQNTDNGAKLMGPSARAATTRNPYCMSPASPRPRATGIVPAGRGSLRSRSMSVMKESRWPGTPLRVDAPHSGCVCDPLDRDEVGTEAQRHLVPICLLAHLREGLLEDFLETDVDLVLFPEQGLEILHPFEVRDGDATGVGQDVGHDRDAAPLENA